MYKEEALTGPEYRLSSREKFIGKTEKRVFKPKELGSLLFQLQDAREWHEDTFWDEEDELAINFVELDTLTQDVVDAIVVEQQPTGAEMDAFSAQPDTYRFTSFTDTDLDAFRANLPESEETQ